MKKINKTRRIEASLPDTSWNRIRRGTALRGRQGPVVVVARSVWQLVDAQVACFEKKIPFLCIIGQILFMRDNVRIVATARSRLRVKPRRVNPLDLDWCQPGANGDVLGVPNGQLVKVVGDKINILLAKDITAAASIRQVIITQMPIFLGPRPLRFDPSATSKITHVQI